MKEMKEIKVYSIAMDSGDGSVEIITFDSEKLAEYHESKNESYVRSSIEVLTIGIISCEPFTEGMATEPILYTDAITKLNYAENFCSDNEDEINKVETELKNL